jgi:hypothetical protein
MLSSIDDWEAGTGDPEVCYRWDRSVLVLESGCFRWLHTFDTVPWLTS